MTAVSFPDDGAQPFVRPLGADVIRSVRYVLWILFFFATSMSVLQYTGRLSEQVAWLSADLAALVLFFRYQSQFINLALSNGVFMSWAILACASAAWSVAPADSLYYGLQLLLTTLVALLICIQYRLLKIVEIVFWAMLMTAVVAFGTAILRPYIGIDGAGNWQGAFPHKNVMGDAMVMLVVSATCLFLQGRWRLITGAAILLGLFLILKTKAATSLLSIMMTMALLPFAWAVVRGRGTFFSLLGLALVMMAFMGAAAYAAITYLGFDPVGFVLSWVGKERTLTGRTLLWDLADRAIDQHPWFGMGFHGYWADPPSEMIQVWLAFKQRLTHFHNNYVEVSVSFGVLGPIVLVMGILVGVIRSVRRLFNATELIEIWPLLLTVQVIILTPVQGPLIANHSMWHVAFIMAAVARK